MDFFKFFPKTLYVFGNEAEELGTGNVETEIFSDISIYVDVIDEVRKNSAYHLKYYIQENDRPDQVSYDLYGTASYHWTFFMMNDNLREQGWPLSNIEMEKKLHIDFPNLVFTTQVDLTGHFFPGQIVVGSTSGARGKVIRRKLDLGQIIIEPIVSLTNPNAKFSPSEVITSKSISAIGTQAAFGNFIDEDKAVRHYTDSTGRIIDIDPAVGPGAFDVPVTQEEFYYTENTALKEINIIKPSLIAEVANAYKQALRV